MTRAKNQQHFLITAILLATFAISACKTIETPNGEIPDEAMAYVDKVVGTYQNPSDSSEIRLRMEGRRLVAEHFSKTDKDILESKCEAEILDLQKIQVSNNNKTIRGTFDFNRNYCVVNLYGETIELQVTETDSRKVLAITYITQNEVTKKCTIEYVPEQGMKEVCSYDSKPVYFRKNFAQK